MNTFLVAVYGSLKQGHGNNQVLQETNSKFIGEGKAMGDYCMVSLGPFPGVFKTRDDNIQGDVFVEVYELDVHGLEALDTLEGNGSFYTREEESINLNDGTQVTAWMYLLPGSYRRYINERDPSVVFTNAVYNWRG